MGRAVSGKYLPIIIIFSVGFILTACQESSEDGSETSAEYVTWATHTDFFVAEGSVHELIDCNTCHGEFDTFKEFTCMSSGCHPQSETDAIHSGFSSYQYDSIECYTCHPAGENDGIDIEDHSLTKFPIEGNDTHASLNCVDCHSNVSSFGDVSCVNCHAHEQGDMDSVHSGISTSAQGYAYATSDCLKCHPDSNVQTISGHTNNFFPVTNGRHSAGQRGCTDCHNSQRSDRSYIAFDFTTFSCYGTCHEHSKGDMDDNHSGEGGYDSNLIWNTPDFMPCVTCHPDGTE